MPGTRGSATGQTRSPARRARGTRLARALATARRKKGLTQDELAGITGVNVDVIRRLEQAANPSRREDTVTREPGFFIVTDLARGLEIPLERLDRESRRATR